MSDTLLSEEDLKQLANSPIARLAVACRDVTDATDEIRENDLLWDQVVEETARRSSRIKSEETAEDVLHSFLDALNHYGGLARSPEDEDESAVGEDGEPTWSPDEDDEVDA